MDDHRYAPDNAFDHFHYIRRATGKSRWRHNLGADVS
jgi:hypothetical protein